MSAPIGVAWLAIFILMAAAVLLVIVVGVIASLTKSKGGGAILAALGIVALLVIPVFLLISIWVFAARSESTAAIRSEDARRIPPISEVVVPSVTPAPIVPRASLEPEQDLRLPRDRNRRETPERSRPNLEPDAPPLSEVHRGSAVITPRLLISADTSENPPVLPAIWQLSDSDLFTARIYPSLMATATPLASKLAGQLRAIRLDGESDEPFLPTSVQISGPKLTEKHRSGLLERFSQQLRKEFPDADVSVVDLAGEVAPGEIEEDFVRIALQMGEQDRRPAWDDSIGQESGTHICRAETAQGDIVVECEYIEKPWLENFDAFVSQRPLKRYVVGYSSSLVSSEHEARRLAMANAEAKSRLQIGPGTYVSASERNVVDRFAQRLSRPYGDVWREAVLLDVSLDRMATVISAGNRHVASRRASQRSSLIGLVVLLGFTALMCVVLNAITQGYYRSRILAGIAAVVILVVVVGWFVTVVNVSESSAISTSVILEH